MKRPSFFFYLMIFFTSVRVFVALNNGLGIDESHYVLYGRWPDFSYFDHPPLVGWIQNFFSHLPGPLNLVARIPALLAGILSSYLILIWLRKLGFQETHAVGGVAALNFALLFEGLSLFFLPDTLLLIFVPALALSVQRLEHKKNLFNWLLLGLLLGLSALSKYTAVLFVLALALRWLQKKYWRDFLTLPFWLGVLLAGLLTVPVVYWNATHNWISFKYQSGHVMSWQNFSLNTLLVSQISQWLGLGFFYTWGLSLFRKPWNFEKFLIFACLAFFSFFAAFGNFLPHWMAPSFVLAIPWGVSQSLSRGYLSRPLKISFIFSSLLWALVNLELIFHVLPISISKHLYRDLQGWPEFISQLTTETHQNNVLLGVTHWTFASHSKLYSKFPTEVFLLDDRFDQYDIWNKESPVSKDFWILVEIEKEAELLKLYRCEKMQDLGKRPLQWRSETLIDFKLIGCKNFNWNNLN